MRLLLLLAAALAFVARNTVFNEGGDVGAWFTVIVFWGSLLTVLALSVRPAINAGRMGDRLAIVQWALGATCLVLLAVAAFVDDWTANDILLLSLFALAGVSVARWRARRSA